MRANKIPNVGMFAGTLDVEGSFSDFSKLYKDRSVEFIGSVYCSMFMVKLLSTTKTALAVI